MDKKRIQSSFQDDRSNVKDVLANIHKNRTNTSLILDGINDDKNIGSIFRIADGSRLKHIYFHNCTYNLQSKSFKKTARSVLDYVKHSDITIEEIEALKKTHSIIGIEKTNDSVAFNKFSFQKPVLLILGNEQHGISQGILDLCEACVHIPMLGVNSSLNVAVACGVVVFGLV